MNIIYLSFSKQMTNNARESTIAFLSLKETKFGFIGIHILRLIARKIYATRSNTCWMTLKWSKYYGVYLHEEDISTTPCMRIEQWPEYFIRKNFQYDYDIREIDGNNDYDDDHQYTYIKEKTRLVKLNIMNKSVVIYFFPNGRLLRTDYHDLFAKEMEIHVINLYGGQRDSITIYLIQQELIFMRDYPRADLVKKHSEHCEHW
jgi:hypothetical protein